MPDPFVVDEQGFQEVHGAVTVTGWGPGGGPRRAEEADCLAKEVHDPATGSRRYFLKRAASGPCAGRLYNPHLPLFRPSDLPSYVFRPATAESFQEFLDFLRTGNPAHVLRAERL